MLLAALVAAANLATAAPRVGAVPRDRGQGLIDAGDYGGAATHYRDLLKNNPSDSEAHLKLGTVLLKLDDPAGADEHFVEVLSKNPSASGRVARIWKAQGQLELRDKNLARASASFTKAVSLDKTLGQPLGIDLIKAADLLTDENERARLVKRASFWSGNAYAALRSASYYARKFGPSRKLKLDEPGWVALVEGLRPGDVIHYVSSEKLQQKDAVSVRILPAAVELPVKLAITAGDVNETGETALWVGRADKPVEAWFWILPGGVKR